MGAKMSQLLKFFITALREGHRVCGATCRRFACGRIGRFFSPRIRSSGEDVVARINKGLEECDVFIPVLSAAGLEILLVQRRDRRGDNVEHQPSREGRPRIIPALVEDCAAALPPLLQHRLHISFAPAYLSALWELLKRGFGLDPASCVYRANMFSGPRLQTGQEQGDDVFGERTRYSNSRTQRLEKTYGSVLSQRGTS